MEDDSDDETTKSGRDVPERVLAILNERDQFRLVIRGHALVDDALDKAINDAFAAGTPEELRRLRLRSRLALARALEILDQDLSKAVSALADIRHGLAHGAADDVTTPQIERLFEMIEPFLPDGIDLSRFDDDARLRISIALIWGMTDGLSEWALQRRQEAEKALAAYRKSQALTQEEVDELLRESEADS